MVYYLKYRPKKFSDLDSVEAREKLQSLLKGKIPDEIPHAFLFTGTRGLGKTSTARIIAKAINCTNRKGTDIEPCNKCTSCRAINNGTNLDVIEIDAASNRGIDEIRDLREKIRLSPVMSNKKVYIIDEVHMLTNEAFNALLKTLEEPPDHAFFMLCTTEAQKVPDTIKSRCFNLTFSRASRDELVSSFERIVKGEKLKADKEALEEIALLSDGSFRDGAKIIEELSTSSNISLNVIERKYKSKTINLETKNLITALNEKNASKGIEIVNSLFQVGIDFKVFTEKLIDELHKMLLYQAKNAPEKTNSTKDLIELLAKTHMEIKYAVLPQLPLELAIVEWCYEQEDSSKYKVLSDDVDLKKDTEGQSTDLNEKTKPIVTKKPGTQPPKDDRILVELIESVKKENFSIAGVMRSCTVEEFSDKELTLTTNYNFHKERLSDKKVIELLEKNMLDITGKKVKVSIKLID